MSLILPALPLLVPLTTGLLAIFFLNRPRIQRVLDVVGSTALLIVGLLLLGAVVQSPQGVLTLHLGGWAPPLGIALVADLFGALLVATTGLLATATSLNAALSTPVAHLQRAQVPASQFLLTGVSGAFLTGDLFNLFVWFEVLLMASFVLMTPHGDRRRMRAALQYVAINLLASALFLAGAGIFYAKFGTLAIGELGALWGASDQSSLMLAGAALLLVAFGVKASIFPLFFWLPDSYPAAPPASAALFSGLLTKVGAAALVRLCLQILPASQELWQPLLAVVVGLTMIVGVTGAVARSGLRPILSFHIVSQIGYILLGLALPGPGAVAAMIFYFVHHMVVKTSLFLAASAIERLEGSGDLKSLGGLASTRPILAVVFLVPALSLAGLPPLSGFWAKVAFLREAASASSWLLFAAILAVGFLTLGSMLKIWNAAFWTPRTLSPSPSPSPMSKRQEQLLVVPPAILGAVSVIIGLFPGPLWDLSVRAASILLLVSPPSGGP